MEVPRGNEMPTYAKIDHLIFLKDQIKDEMAIASNHGTEDVSIPNERIQELIDIQRDIILLKQSIDFDVAQDKEYLELVSRLLYVNNLRFESQHKEDVFRLHKNMVNMLPKMNNKRYLKLVRGELYLYYKYEKDYLLIIPNEKKYYYNIFSSANILNYKIKHITKIDPYEYINKKSFKSKLKLKLFDGFPLGNIPVLYIDIIINKYINKGYKNVSNPTTEIYLVYNKNTGYTKIGRSNDVLRRLNTMKCYIPNGLSLIHTFTSRMTTEKKLHIAFKSKRIDNSEWFSLNETDILFIKENYNNKKTIQI